MDMLCSEDIKSKMLVVFEKVRNCEKILMPETFVFSGECYQDSYDSADGHGLDKYRDKICNGGEEKFKTIENCTAIKDVEPFKVMMKYSNEYWQLIEVR